MKRLRYSFVLIGLVLTVAPLLAQEAESRPDYGVLNGRRYMNGYFGFSYRFPEGWTGNAIQSSSSGASHAYSLFTTNPPVSSGADVRYIEIHADSWAKGDTPKDFLEATVKMLAGPTGAFEALHTDKRSTFGGKQFYRVDLRSKSAPGSPVFYQTRIFTMLRNYALTFSFMAANSDDLEDLVRTMESLNFSEPGRLPPVPAPVVAH